MQSATGFAGQWQLTVCEGISTRVTISNLCSWSSHTDRAHFSRTEACPFTLYHQRVNYQQEHMPLGKCTLCSLSPTHTFTTHMPAVTLSFLSRNHFGGLKLLQRFHLFMAVNRLDKDLALAVQICIKTHNQQHLAQLLRYVKEHTISKWLTRGWCSPLSHIKSLVGQGWAGATKAGVSRYH